MAVVNRVDIKKKTKKTDDEFATSLINIIKRKSLSYNEAGIIFDKYTLSSLKTSMRAKRTNGIAARFKVTDKTNIEHLTTKQFLANIETKNDLMMCLAEKVETYLNNLDYVVGYGNTCITNMMNLKETLFDYNQEEADTSIVLHALDVPE